MKKLRHTLLALACAAAAGNAGAHDTWFEVHPAGAARLALGTGNQFPAFETGIDASYLAQQGCRRSGAGGAVVPMKPLGQAAAALLLRAPADASTCWAQLSELQIELPPDKVALYLRELQASAELRATWAEMAGRGVKWVERYTKHARIELGLAAPAPVPMGMDMIVETSAGAPAALRAGDTLRVRVLRDGQPLAGFAVEWRSDASRQGLWQRTDAEGRFEMKLPMAGHTLLRGIDLRLSATERDVWVSRFMTLSLQVLPRS